jgi:cold shock CspA family protein
VTKPEPKQGLIISIMYERSYGFISPFGEEDREIFFHESASTDFQSLTPGDTVSFVEIKAKKGYRALNVAKVAPSAEAKA